MGTLRYRQEKRVTGLAPGPYPPTPVTGMDVSWHQGPPQDDQGWPPMNATTRPWRSAPPSPPPPGTRHTGTLPTLGDLHPITQAVPVKIHQRSHLLTCCSLTESVSSPVPPHATPFYHHRLWVSALLPPLPQPWGPVLAPCSPCRPSSFWTWSLRPSPAA